MIILDSNVISELMRVEPNRQVVEWMDNCPADSLCLTAITVAEILFGINVLPAGKRKKRLFNAAANVFEDFFQKRIFPFDLRAAVEYAEVVTIRKDSGRPISTADAQIAAICRSRKAALATRNSKDFTATGVSLVNPWKESKGH